MAKKKRHQNSNNIWIDESAFLPDALLEQQPYMNKNTKEVQYMTVYEYYMLGIGFHDNDPEHRDYANWEPVEDSPTMRALFGNNRKKKT